VTEPIVPAVSSTRGGAQAVAVRPGFELLGKYVESDIRGLGLLYRDVRALVEGPSQGRQGDEIVSDAHEISADGSRTTITLIYAWIAGAVTAMPGIGTTTDAAPLEGQYACEPAKPRRQF